MIVHIVDDNHIVLLVVGKIIKKTKLSENVYSFKNGEEALSILKRGIKDPELLPDVILLDINMPIVDGWEFLEEYKKLKPELEKDIEIYMLTSSISERDIERAAKISHVKGYITKPVTKDKIMQIKKSA